MAVVVQFHCQHCGELIRMLNLESKEIGCPNGCKNPIRGWDGTVAQSVEPSPFKRTVAGSIPASPTKIPLAVSKNFSYKGSAVLGCIMDEKQIRLHEVELLETYLNHNQIENGPIRNYVDHRRRAIAMEFPDLAELGQESAQVEGEQAGAGDPGSGVQSEQQPATQSAQGEGTQSPTPDAATQASSASAS